MNVPGGCLFLRALQVIRASGRKGVPPHRASQHVGTDLSRGILLRSEKIPPLLRRNGDDEIGNFTKRSG
jgi:hypothetical protein